MTSYDYHGQVVDYALCSCTTSVTLCCQFAHVLLESREIYTVFKWVCQKTASSKRRTQPIRGRRLQTWRDTVVAECLPGAGLPRVRFASLVFANNADEL